MEPAEEFHNRTMEQIRECRKIGYDPIGFIRIIAEYGNAMQATKHVLNTDKPYAGLATLYEKGRLDLSVEYLALQPEFRELFTPHELVEAEKRLRELNFDPNAPLGHPK